MWASILKFLASSMDWIKTSWDVSFLVLTKFFRAPFVLFVGIVGVFKGVYSGIVFAQDRLFVSLSSFESAGVGHGPSSDVGSGIISIFEKVNYVFPLAESFGLLTALFTLWIAACTYRLIKSFIPTLS